MIYLLFYNSSICNIFGASENKKRIDQPHFCLKPFHWNKTEPVPSNIYSYNLMITLFVYKTSGVFGGSNNSVLVFMIQLKTILTDRWPYLYLSGEKLKNADTHHSLYKPQSSSNLAQRL